MILIKYSVLYSESKQEIKHFVEVNKKIVSLNKIL